MMDRPEQGIAFPARRRFVRGLDRVLPHLPPDTRRALVRGSVIVTIDVAAELAFLDAAETALAVEKGMTERGALG